MRPLQERLHGPARLCLCPLHRHWTISDNWEWADGYCPKFGLAAVNRSNPLLRRVPRDSYHLFAEVVRSRRVTVAQRHAAWRRVTTAAANGEMKEVCRSGDALGSLDTPDRWPVLGGTTLPDGRVVDWRYDDAKVSAVLCRTPPCSAGT